MARTRTTKKLAQRIDLNYFKRPTPLKRAKFWLSLVLLPFALLWIAEKGLFRDSRVYSSGRLSRAHAVLEKECSACHVSQAGAYSAKAADGACLDCHDGPAHHLSQVPAPDCATCHTEHRGSTNLSAVMDHACANCHKNLRNSLPDSTYASGISSLQNGHPEFAAFRRDGPNYGHDLGTIKLNHAIHMRPIRSGPMGPNVQLQCGNCHHTSAVAPNLTYSDPKYRAARVSYKESDEVRLTPPGTLPPKPKTGRELMALVKFADACTGCHLLTFDKRFDFGVPHDEPRVVREFLQSKYQEYISFHPAELRVMRDPGRDLTGKSIRPEVRIVSPKEWVREQTDRAEDLLWRKTCNQCHLIGFVFREDHRTPEELSRWLKSALQNESGERPLPEIEYALTTVQWMPHARFDHDAHRGFSCVSCHAKALTSTESSDILLPGIAVCKTCHAPGPGHADSRCSECHTYHDWSKRKEVIPKFTLPALRTGGQ